MSSRPRIAASVIALAVAWWFGMLAERSRSGALGGESNAHAATHETGDADATARREAARAAEMRAAREHADAFPDRAPVPPRDLAARFEDARKAPSEVQRIRRLIVATGDLSAEEIPAALALAAHTSGEKGIREVLQMALLARWAELDPQAAAVHATQESTKSRSTDAEMLKTVIGECGVRDPAAAADFVAGLDDERRGKAVTGLLAGVATTQPETALALLARFPEAAKDSASYEVIFGAWSERDPRSAAARAGALPPGDFRERALAGIAEHWAQRDPATAYAWATQLGDPEERHDALRKTLRAWADRDPQAAANQALASGDHKFLLGVSDDIARELAQSDVPAAQRFAARLTDGEARGAAMSEVVLQMTEKSCAAAAAYANQIPEGSQRCQALSNLCGSWAQRDPVANAQWLATLPASGSRDAAVKTYVERTVELDPEGALAWAVSIGDAEKRTETLVEGGKVWFKKAPQAAQAWLDANRTLPDDARAELTPRK